MLAERLGAGALPGLTELRMINTHVGGAGASALAAALGQGALPRLKELSLRTAGICDAALMPSRRPCGGCPRWCVSASLATRSATRALTSTGPGGDCTVGTLYLFLI